MSLRPSSVSRNVDSRQDRVHPRLESVVERHISSAWNQPLHRPTVEAFADLAMLGIGSDHRLVLDSGCGTGESTRRIAQSLPDCLVIGVDKSLSRLSRTGIAAFPHREGNAVWLRAELSSFWRLALHAGWRLERHYLLYPNPWPKPAHLQRRWHAHPVFPDLLRLGGRLEMRCNWEIYALEFAAAVNRIFDQSVSPKPLIDSDAISPFERKYRDSGHRLYSVVVTC